MRCQFKGRAATWVRVIAVTGAVVAGLATPATAQQSASMAATASVIQVPLQQQVTDSALTVVMGDVAHKTPVELPAGVRVALVSKSGGAARTLSGFARKPYEAVVELSYTAN